MKNIQLVRYNYITMRMLRGTSWIQENKLRYNVLEMSLYVLNSMHNI